MPGTPLTPVLIGKDGKGHILGGWWSKIEIIQVLGEHRLPPESKEQTKTRERQSCGRLVMRRVCHRKRAAGSTAGGLRDESRTWRS